MSGKREKPVNMVRHHQKQVDKPTAQAVVMLRRVDQNAGRGIRENMAPAIRRANCDKVDGPIRNPGRNLMLEAAFSQAEA